MKKLIRYILCRIRGEVPTNELKKRGLKIGKNFQRMSGCSLDESHCWLIEIGDNVTFAPNVRLLAHDASTMRELGYTVIGRVIIGSNVFVGADSLILPNVSVGSRVIIGAGSVVTKGIPDNCVVAGSPARIICDYESYINKRKKEMDCSPVFSEDYTIRKGISKQKKNEMLKSLKGRVGFVK